MSSQHGKRTIWIGLGATVVLAFGGWVAGGQIRSPAQIAAETAAPNPSAITVPVERRVLSSEVIGRGTVRYGSPQPVVLATSEAKQSAGSASSDIVTTRPRRGARFGEGTTVMSVSGRPVFVLRGAMASHRDLGPGSVGPDVRQLEQALKRLGFDPGAIDGRYDGATAGAVADWYESGGWEPFGPTDTQLDQLRAARSAAAAARDAYLQSKVAIQTAKERATPTEIEQARIELATAREAVDTAVHGTRSQKYSISLALANARKDNALAAADVITKRSALNKARDALADAQQTLALAPPATSPAERATLETAVRQARDDVSAAQADLNAATASQRATKATGRDAVAKARADVAQAGRALRNARRQVTLASRRLTILTRPGDTSLQQAVSVAAAAEMRATERDANRLARRMGIRVPANEVLFFPTLPLRVDSVRVRRGESVSGRVMTVSNTRLAIDSSLSLNDAKLVRPGAEVKIEEPDLGIKTTGKVAQVASAPGTHKVDPGRVYLQVTPGTAPAQLVGASVKLTIAVRSTKEAVLVVPVTALSVGADGSSRLQVQRSGGGVEYVQVEPGLAAQGLVEVRPVNGELKEGDLVVVGERGKATGGASPGDSGAPGGGGAEPGATGESAPSGRGAGATGATGATGSGGSSKETPSEGPTSPGGEGTSPRDGPSTGTTP
jgi:multidrug efflux pump subunit AcrA (membrane-fusion protein)